MLPRFFAIVLHKFLHIVAKKSFFIYNGNIEVKGITMALHTSNIYGNITISDEAVSMIVSRVAQECYGVVELPARRLSDSLMLLFHREPTAKGVKITTLDNRIFVDLYVIIKNGINRDALVDSLQSAVKYHVEHITGMRVMAIDVHVVGVRL